MSLTERAIRPTWFVAKMVAMIVVGAAVTASALVATPTRADAASCRGSACHGKSPSTEGCTPGTEFGAVYFLSGKARIAMRRNGDCGTTPRWARLVWDGSYPNPPFRFNFKIERRLWQGDPVNSWTRTHVLFRTTDGSAGTFVTNMIATAVNTDAQFRACARSAVATGADTWSSWSAWTCTSWRIV